MKHYLAISFTVKKEINDCGSINLIPRLHDTTGCQTGCTTGLTTGLTTVLKEQLFVQPVVKPGCKPRFDNRLYTR